MKKLFSTGQTVTISTEAIEIMNRDFAGAVFLEHIVFWCHPDIRRRNEDGWTYKTKKDWEALYLKRADVERSRKRLKDLGILEEKREGMPPILYYRVDYDRLAEVRSEFNGGVYTPMPISDQDELKAARHESETTQDELITTTSDILPSSLPDILPEEEPPLSPKVGGEYSEEFLEFWEKYPKKVAKRAACKAWGRLNKTEKDAVMACIPNHEALKRKRQFIPEPPAFLNGRRWEDDTSQETADLKRSKDILAKWREENPNEYE